MKITRRFTRLLLPLLLKIIYMPNQLSHFLKSSTTEEYISIYDQKNLDVHEILPQFRKIHRVGNKLKYNACILLYMDENEEYNGYTNYMGLTCADYEVFKDFVNKNLTQKIAWEYGDWAEYHKIELAIIWE